MKQFLLGAIMMAFWVAGLFFFRFWKETKDRLFVIFALAFWVLAINQIGFVYVKEEHEAHTYFYLVHLLAFILILIAIADKNRSNK